MLRISYLSEFKCDLVGAGVYWSAALTKLFMDAPPKSPLSLFVTICRTYHKYQRCGRCGYSDYLTKTYDITFKS